MRESNSHRTSPPVFGTGAIPLGEPSANLIEAGAGGVEPPSLVLETNMLPVTPCSHPHSLRNPEAGHAGSVLPGSWLPECVLLFGAEGGNRTRMATGTSGFTGRRNSILPPQHIEIWRYSIVKKPKRSESVLNSKLRSGRSSRSRLSLTFGDFGSGIPLPLNQL